VYPSEVTGGEEAIETHLPTTLILHLFPSTFISLGLLLDTTHAAVSVQWISSVDYKILYERN
jgi:hypothetical protein